MRPAMDIEPKNKSKKIKMKSSTLDISKDPMGKAIYDYYNSNRTYTLRVLSSMLEEDEMPVSHLFRTPRQMPGIEQTALSMAKGRILDVGAAAGCHALPLQEAGHEVKAIDISPYSCMVMRDRGIQDVECISLFDHDLRAGYDTILLLMNGTGIAGTLRNLLGMLVRLKKLLNEGGTVLIDSSDIKYLYEGDGEDYLPDNEKYYGEIDFQMIYGETVGEPFNWLYVDFPLLKNVAESCGMKCNMVSEGDHFDYLAVLSV